MPDNIPVIGPSQTAPGLFHAFGFTGHRFAWSPIVGSLRADPIIDGDSPIPLDAFRPGSFNP